MTDPFDEVAAYRDQSVRLRNLMLVTTSAWILSDRHGRSFEVADGGPTIGSADRHHHRFLREVLAADRVGEAWLVTDPATAADFRDAAAFAETVHSEPWVNASENPVRISALVDELDLAVEEVAGGVLTGAGAANDDDTERAARLRYRIQLDADRFRTAIADDGFTAEADFRVVLDVHFHGVRQQLRCHVTAWIFAVAPDHPGFSPEPGGAPAAGDLTEPIDRYHRTFTAVADALVRRLRRANFSPMEFRGHWRRYDFPQFWVALPGYPATDPREYLTSRPDLVPLIEATLDVRDAEDNAVAKSVLNGDLLVLRRVRREYEGVRPERIWRDVSHYLTIPDQRLLDGDPLRLQFSIEHLVLQLTELEVEFSDDLYQLEADLEIWDNHIRLFNIMSERASTLWDALSTHLPIRRRGRLATVHRAIELLHQLLMQALADLAHIEALVGARVTKIDDAMDNLRDNFDFNFAERAADQTSNGVRQALDNTYLYQRVHRFGVDVRSEGKRVKTAFRDLIQTIGAAFDERRVRELDVLQRAGIWIGSGIAIVGLAALLPTVVSTNQGTDRGFTDWLSVDDARLAGQVIFAMIGVVLATMIGFTVRWYWRVGRLGSRQFRPVYGGRLRDRLGWRLARRGQEPGRTGVWGFLQHASTARLEWLAERGQLTDAYDRSLAADFADLWDRSQKLWEWDRADQVRADITGLSHQVEEWGLHGLLLTERARRLHRYPVPVLTCLYRCGSRIAGSFLDLRYLPQTRVVAYVDFARSMERVGFSWSEAEEIDKWLRRPAYARAADALARVDRLGLTARMDAGARAVTLATVRAELGPPPPTPYQPSRVPEKDRDPQLTAGG